MTPLALQERALSKQQFLSDVLTGLCADQKTLPCKYFYDQRGSELFEQICDLDEYYLTRAELEILQRHGDQIAAALGPRCALVEYGSGSSMKTRQLLARLKQPVALVPVDISREHLRDAAQLLAKRFPELAVCAVCADFTQPFELPDVVAEAERAVVYFPGSTIGNFSPREASALLETIAALVGRTGGLLIGVDLQKPRHILEAAYNDPRLITAAFNLNLLRRMNRELGADFQVRGFQHHAVYADPPGRIEMHLVSRREQIVHVDGTAIHFAAGESIHTENSYKYTPEQFAAMAAAADLRVSDVWFDPQRLFSVQYLTPRNA